MGLAANFGVGGELGGKGGFKDGVVGEHLFGQGGEEVGFNVFGAL